MTELKVDSTLNTNTSGSSDVRQIQSEQAPSIYMEANSNSQSAPEADTDWSFSGFIKDLFGLNIAKNETEEVDLPEHKKANADVKTAGREIGDRLVEYAENEKMFIKEVEYLVGLNSNMTMQWASNQYAKATGKSLVLAIENLSGSQESKELKAKFKDIALKDGNYFKREYLALDLMNALNSEDTAEIEKLINSLNSSNVQGVYSAYATMTETTGEKMFQGNSFTAGKREILGGRSNESLLQGILNNKELSGEKKSEYLYKFIECAVSSNKVKDSSAKDFLLRDKRSLVGEALDYNNAFYIEKKIAELFGFE